MQKNAIRMFPQSNWSPPLNDSVRYLTIDQISDPKHATGSLILMGFSNVFLGDSHAEIAPLLTNNPNRANFIADCLNGFLNKDEQINFLAP